MGDLNDAREEDVKSRTSARNMGGGSFRIRTLGHVRAEMRDGNASILTGSCRAEHKRKTSGQETLCSLRSQPYPSTSVGMTK